MARYGMDIMVREGMVAFEDFVAPHLQMMWLLATRMAGPQDREDIVQEALTTAWRKFDTYDASRGSARTWLLVLVADRSRKHWRSARPTLELVDRPAAVPDFEAHLDVTRAVRKLPRRQRMAVELFYVLGLPVAECALVMGCATGTISSALSDARAALRISLEA